MDHLVLRSDWFFPLEFSWSAVARKFSRGKSRMGKVLVGKVLLGKAVS